MANSDAPRRGNELASPWSHWIQTGFTRQEIDCALTLASSFFHPSKVQFTFLFHMVEATYQAPAFTSSHQYIFFVSKSARDDVSFDQVLIPVTDLARRRSFHLKDFEDDHQ